MQAEMYKLTSCQIDSLWLTSSNICQHFQYAFLTRRFFTQMNLLHIKSLYSIKIFSYVLAGIEPLVQCIVYPLCSYTSFISYLLTKVCFQYPATIVLYFVLLPSYTPYRSHLILITVASLLYLYNLTCHVIYGLKFKVSSM